jgi:hypothetical protein
MSFEDHPRFDDWVALVREMPALFAQHPGKYVLWNDGLRGVCETYDAVMSAGYAQFGLGDFFIHELREDHCLSWATWLSNYDATNAEYASWDCAALRKAMSDGPQLPEPAANVSWWRQSAFDASRIDLLKQHARPTGHVDSYQLDLYTAEQMHDYGKACAASSQDRVEALERTADADGRCTRCGLEFEDPAELAHECPPGFTGRSPT